MDKQKQSSTTKLAPAPAKPESRSRAIAERGIYTAADFAAYMSAMISDVTCGLVTPEASNAACNAAGKRLKVVETVAKHLRKLGHHHVKLNI